MAKTKEKNLARELYINTSMTLVDISAQVKVSQKTLTDWKVQEGWESLKAAKHVTRQEIISKKYELLKNMVDDNLIKQKCKELTNADIDAEHKLSLSIKALQDEETLSGYIQAFTPFLKWAQIEHPKQAKDIAELTQKFLLMKAEELS